MYHLFTHDQVVGAVELNTGISLLMSDSPASMNKMILLSNIL